VYADYRDIGGAIPTRDVFFAYESSVELYEFFCDVVAVWNT
jgi:hypothetical protein